MREHETAKDREQDEELAEMKTGWRWAVRRINERISQLVTNQENLESRVSVLDDLLNQQGVVVGNALAHLINLEAEIDALKNAVPAEVALNWDSADALLAKARTALEGLQAGEAKISADDPDHPDNPPTQAAGRHFSK